MKFFSSFITKINQKIQSLSLSKKFFFGSFLIIFILSFLGILNQVSNRFGIQQPVHSGTVREGILGTPRFINPILAISDTDRDLTRIIYSGLVRSIPQNDGTQEIIPDLAESYSLSEDGKTYTFKLKKDNVFHDNTPITSEDVIFTITTIQDSRFQSLLLPQWSGVTTTIIDDVTFSFTLSHPFSGFLETIAETGILPKHIWKNLTVDEFIASSWNISPIGSGPYRVKKIIRDTTGTIQSYTLQSFNKFALGKPYIKKFVFKFYSNEQNLLQGYQTKSFDLLANIHPYEITPQNTKQVFTTPLPRMFGLFINENNSEIFKNKKLQEIITLAINYDEIIQNVFQGYAKTITYPIPNQDNINKNFENRNLEKELDVLGWKLNPETGIREKDGKPLVWNISTADTSELKYTAQIIQKQLKVIGIMVEIHIFPLNDLESSIIKDKSFETLLFGQLVKNDGDLYAFWHSSQRNNLELNITGYTNSRIDTILETLITTTDTTSRNIILNELKEEIIKAPVIWLFQPDFMYVTNNIIIYGIEPLSVTTRDDRFNTIYQWYLNTESIWNIFTK